MNKRFFIQPIFAPNAELLSINLESITSVADYFDFNNYNVSCVFGGYVDSDAYWNELESLISGRFKKYSIKRFDKNYGKAYVINELVSMSGMCVTDSFLSADSDINFIKETEDIYGRLENLSMVLSDTLGKKFGVIALEQVVNSCHLYNHISETVKVQCDGKHETILHSGGGGIAGGCMYTSMESWTVIDGYEKSSIYGGNDGLYFLKNVRLGFFVCLAKDIGIVHNQYKNIDYHEWKMKETHNIRHGIDLSDEQRSERCVEFDNVMQKIKNK